MTDEPKTLTIVSLRSTNVKRLRAVRIEPRSTGLVVISGRNNQGKSSVIDSIAMAIGGKKLCPDEPIRRGEAFAETEVDLGEFKARRSFLPGGRSEVVVTAKDGSRFASPQDMLNGLIGQLSFDPLAFSRMDAKAQGETLRRVAGLDFGPLDGQRATIYEERTAVGRESVKLRGQLSAMPALAANVPEEPVDITALAKDVREAQARNGANQKERDQLGMLTVTLAAAAERISKLRQELDKSLVEHDAMLVEHRKTCVHVQGLTDVPTGPLLDQISQAEATNAKVRIRHERQRVMAEAAGLDAKHEALTKNIAAIDDEKLKRTAAAAMPVPGLGFTPEGGVTFEGIPLEQASASQQLRVAVGIGLASNPRLRVLLVRDGSLLDNDSMKLLAELAESAGAQVWVETVERREQTSVVIEDGEVQQ